MSSSSASLHKASVDDLRNQLKWMHLGRPETWNQRGRELRSAMRLLSNTPLCNAILDGKNLDEIKSIVSASAASVNEKTLSGVTRKISKVTNDFPFGGNTPLHYAAKRGDPEIVEFLLASGAKVDKRNASGKTPLMKCFTSVRCAELLVNAGADVNAVNYDNYVGYGKNSIGHVSPLFQIISKGKGEEFGALVNFLLRRGALVNFAVKISRCFGEIIETPLSVAIELGRPIQIIRALLEHGANDFSKTDPAKPLLFHTRDINVIELLLDFGHNPNVCNSHGHSILEVVDCGFFTTEMGNECSCCYRKSLERYPSDHKIAKLLISRGAKFDGFKAKSPYVAKKQAQKLSEKYNAAAAAASSSSSSSCRLCGQKRLRD